MNVSYEEWGNAIREGAERLGAKLDANKLASQLAERGTTLIRKHRKRKVEIALAVGFVGGVAATLIAVKLAESVKRKRKKLRNTVELLRERDADEKAETEERE